MLERALSAALNEPVCVGQAIEAASISLDPVEVGLRSWIGTLRMGAGVEGWPGLWLGPASLRILAAQGFLARFVEGRQGAVPAER